MRIAIRLPRVLALAAVLPLALASARSARAALDVAIERFAVDGNTSGPPDGTPDLVDEFDDGALAPGFALHLGTATEQGGALHLESPGHDIAVPGVTPYLETSAVISTGSVLQSSSGDAVYRAVLAPQGLAANQGVNFLLRSVEPTALYYTGISFVNFNTTLADFYQPPLTPGLAILSHQESLGLENRQITMENLGIPAGAITGPVVLELRYDDAAREIRTAYSLDGGAIFAAPFAPMPLESADGTAAVSLAATAGPAGTCPAEGALDSARLTGLGRPSKSRLRLTARLGGHHRGYQALRLRLRDEGAANAVLMDVQLPDALPATPKCDPRDGWKGRPAGTYTYVSVSDALPPACAPGSAQGLKAVKFRWTGIDHVTLKASKASLPPIVGPLRLEIYRGTGPVNDCDGIVARGSCRVGPGSASCKS